MIGLIVLYIIDLVLNSFQTKTSDRGFLEFADLSLMWHCSFFQIFRKARAVAPSIIFFDELDALAVERGR